MRRIALAITVLAAGCTYDFRNPAEDLGQGQALGRVVVESSGGVSPLAGVLVTLDNGPTIGQSVTRSSGHFTLLSLPVGAHAVTFRKGAERAGHRLVEIVPGRDGRPEGVDLGDVPLDRTVTIEGAVVLAQPGAFSPTLADVTDEVSGLPAALATDASSAATYRFTLRGVAPGPHRIHFAVAGTEAAVRVFYTAPPLTFDIPSTSAGQVLSLQPVSLQRASAATAGSLRLRVQVVAPDPPAPGSVARLELFDAVLDPAATGTTFRTLPMDSAGFAEATAVPGAYVVKVVPTSGAFVAPPLVRAAVQPGLRADLGTVYLMDAFTADRTSSACFVDADCGTGTCVDLRCQGGSSQPVSPPAAFGVPFCLPAAGPCFQGAAGFGQPCGGAASPYFGTCMMACEGGVRAGWVCVPDGAPVVSLLGVSGPTSGAECTPDGSSVTAGFDPVFFDSPLPGGCPP